MKLRERGYFILRTRQLKSYVSYSGRVAADPSHEARKQPPLVKNGGRFRKRHFRGNRASDLVGGRHRLATGVIPVDVLDYELIFNGVDGHLEAPLVLVLELHDTVYERIDGVVSTEPNVATRMPLGAALTNDDVAGSDELATKLLDATVLRIAVPTVARRADAFLMCHVYLQGIAASSECHNG